MSHIGIVKAGSAYYNNNYERVNYTHQSHLDISNDIPSSNNHCMHDCEYMCAPTLQRVHTTKLTTQTESPRSENYICPQYINCYTTVVHFVTDSSCNDCCGCEC